MWHGSPQQLKEKYFNIKVVQIIQLHPVIMHVTGVWLLKLEVSIEQKGGARMHPQQHI